MTATDTAARVLGWSASEPSAPLPRGDLTGAAGLADPGRDVTAAAARLAAVTAARLRLPSPPLGDRGPVGPGPVLLAAVIGARTRPREALAVAAAVPRAGSAFDRLARHGVVAPAVARLTGPLRAAVLDASPLTGLFGTPSRAGEPAAEEELERLLAHADGRTLAAVELAGVPADAAQARWRGDLLDGFRLADRAFVLDVYEKALRFHGAEHRERLAEAVRDNGELAEATAAWWRPLAALERSHRQLLRARPGLVGYPAGIDFARRRARLAAMVREAFERRRS
ncbi:hypothetical protein DMA12_21120 [Amycolatopsis balhimycina DSM 5908]|uniref:FtsH ternary system domain-containing protein n=1 Tax=Amycolatopsis balhimycina DSM 5908 TaxID=1081091 RepID=A0A428WI79_AMYBA|nr:hypothetical protein [Amycolatopsis balhimycina]RSM42723.1 hypothetical protein DMA12_21120 [Amycolatopsis balhimycina DSM 5908]